MEIHLSSFELEINETILERGQKYFKKGKVVRCEEMSPGMYEAQVEGTDTYMVKFKREGDTISDIECSCPYVDGPVCKHFAAVLFYLSESRNGEDALPEAEPQKVRKPKACTASGCKVSDLHFPKEISLYRKQLTSVIHASMGRYRFIDYGKSFRVAKEGERVLNIADQFVEKGMLHDAIELYWMVAVKMISSLLVADDSVGLICSCVSYPLNRLASLSRDVTGAVRKNLCKTALKHIEKGTFSDWIWDNNLMTIAICCMETQKDFDVLLQHIDTQLIAKGNEKSGSFRIEKLQVHRYELLKAFGKTEEAARYLQNNLQNFQLRNIAIDGAVRTADFQRAYQLAEEAVVEWEKAHGRFCNHWHEKILNIALAEKNGDRVVEEARALVLSRYSDEHLQLLREYVPLAEWTDFVASLAEEAFSRSCNPLYTTLCIEENWMDRLMDYVENNVSLNNLDEFTNVLKAQYADRLIELYEKAILIDVQNQYMKNRKYYKFVCREIRKMKKLGGLRQAEALVATLKKMYPRYPAFQEELANV